VDRFLVSTLGPMVNGGIFAPNTAIYDSKLRPDLDNDPYSISTVTRGGFPWVKYHVNPISPALYLPGSADWHFRAEISRYPWLQLYPVGTEIWLGISYEMDALVNPNWKTGLSIFQVHGGSTGGNDSPSVAIEVAYKNQLNTPGNIYRQTLLGGEIQIVNTCRGLRWSPPNGAVRLMPGGRLDMVIQLVYGVNSAGLFRVWLNDTYYPFPGYDAIPSGDVGTTVNSVNPGTGLYYGGNCKIGLYHHGFKSQGGYDANIAAGHSWCSIYGSSWNMMTRTAASPDYLQMNAYNLVSTSNYNRAA
jgi:hypothetical protein